MDSTAASHASSRRDFLKQMSAAAVGTQFLGIVTQQAQGGQLPSQMNIMLIMTDQTPSHPIPEPRPGPTRPGPLKSNFALDQPG